MLLMASPYAYILLFHPLVQAPSQSDCKNCLNIGLCNNGTRVWNANHCNLLQ
ncbi:hypothetical protein Lalb_Chr23g0275291 [Lupinus albus]|uniref:Uncharacterized protein n=1 Tax=Lupinus albus TaxID=3870 RepID=A0A6A4N5L0_LUPAL|nr:hypothetical protein Lalb_Chr23g0275291 [Lupinus albus]